MILLFTVKSILSENSCDNLLRCKDTCLPCYHNCDYIFQGIAVTPARAGGSLIQWVLSEHIRDAGEYVYSLQVSNAGVDDPKAWTTVQEGADVCLFIDPERRLPGVHNFTHYRVKLQTDEGVYFSRPLHTFGKLNYADWRLAESILRAESVLLTSRSGTVGTLLKRKISGRKCPRCLNPDIGVVEDSDCKICYGIGWVGGYYAPVPCFYINLDPSGSTIQKDVEMQGNVAETRAMGRAIAAPLLTSGDVWVNGESSERFKIMQLQHLAEMKGIPLVYKVAMERLPFADATYSIPIQ